VPLLQHARHSVAREQEKFMNRSDEVIPLLRWAGSKRKLVPILLEACPKAYKRYIEPFAGSACVFVALQPRRAILSDINGELISAYETIRDSSNAVADQVNDWPVTKRFYYALRSKDPTAMQPVERAARFIYLNRRCFNGVYRLNMEGRFNVPLGSKTGPMPTRQQVTAFASLLARTELRACDFEKTISRASSGDFIYADPPYYRPNVRFRGEYGWNAFRPMDEERLVESLRQASDRGAQVLLSYTNRLADCLRGWRRRSVRVSRSVAGFAADRRRVVELLYQSYPDEQP
jgi:DNA adenine methylase